MRILIPIFFVLIVSSGGSNAGVTKEMMKSLVKVAPRGAYHFLDMPVAKRPVVDFLLPRTFDEYEKVFHMRRTSRATEQIEKIQQYVNEGGGRGWSRTLSDLDDSLRSHDTEVHLLVGHSENSGLILVLPTGDRINVSTIEKMCRLYNKKCIIVSCHSRSLGIDRNIEMEVAVHATFAAVNAWNKPLARLTRKKIDARLVGTVPMEVRREASYPNTANELAQYIRRDLDDTLARERRGWVRKSISVTVVGVAIVEAVEGSEGD